MMLNDIVKNLLKEVHSTFATTARARADIPQKILISSPRRAAPVWIFM